MKDKNNKASQFLRDISIKYRRNLYVLFIEQLKHSPVFYILLVLMLLSQPTILSTLLLIDHGMDYSIYLIVIPAICNMAFILYCSYKLLSENRFNYIDTNLISKSFTRNTIMWCKINIIFMFVLTCLAIGFAYSVIFCLATSHQSYILAIFLSNILISPFLYFIYGLFIALISIQLKPIFFTIISSLVLLLTSVPSIFTRPLLASQANKGYVTYNNANYSVAKLCSTKDSYYAIKIKNKDWSYKQLLQEINEASIGNIFIPSEWNIAFYNSVFMNNDITNLSGDHLNNVNSIMNFKLKPIKFTRANNELIVRGQDLNPLMLDTQEIINSILTNIDQIARSNNNVNLLDKNIAMNLHNTLKNNVLWNDETLSQKELSTTRDLTGINTKYNILFYIIKYSEQFSYIFEPLRNEITKKYSQELFDLLSFLCNSKQSNANLFVGNDAVGTKKPIIDFYPNNAIVSEDKPITWRDYEFIKSTLIRFRNNNAYYLDSSGTYIAIDSPAKIDPSVSDEASWEAYINQVSLKYNDTRKLIHKFGKTFPRIYGFTLQNNDISEFAYDYYFQVEKSTYLWITPILISCISIGSIPLVMLLVRNNNKSSYKDL